MFKNIIFILNKIVTFPFKLIAKIKYLISQFYYMYTYNLEEFENKQNNYFNELDLNRAEGLKKLVNLKTKFNLEINKPLSSEHEVLFSSISQKKDKNIMNILEIGTFDGYNCFLLSKLFPNSIIDTIDLPIDDENFKKTYNREKNFDNFIKKRKNFILNNKSINFIQINSVELINFKKKYDLIWVDGAHGYPIITIDIINSYKLLNDNGLILCDDTYLLNSKIKEDNMYYSKGTIETLNLLKKQNLIDYKLIFKRLDKKFNSNLNRKYIAIVNKT